MAPTHNALSRSMDQVPMWLIQSAIAIALSSLLAWATWASVTSWKHDTRIGVVETKVDVVKDDIKEIKEGQKDINRKLDRLIERRTR